jgi:hypothetical protein
MQCCNKRIFLIANISAYLGQRIKSASSQQKIVWEGLSRCCKNLKFTKVLAMNDFRCLTSNNFCVFFSLSNYWLKILVGKVLLAKF